MPTTGTKRPSLISKPVWVIHGPNLNLLGVREPAIYGRQTLSDVDQQIQAKAKSLGVAVRSLQSNLEGEIVAWLQAARVKGSGVILNPGGYTHTSVAIRDAVVVLATAAIPVIEVHLTNLAAREPFRRESLVSAAARGVIQGLGARGYLLALEAVVQIIKDKSK